MKQHITASPVELQKLAQRITDANAAAQEAERTQAIASDLFTMFCEAHGVPGATFVGIADGTVIVDVPEQKPELVKETA